MIPLREQAVLTANAIKNMIEKGMPDGCQTSLWEHADDLMRAVSLEPLPVAAGSLPPCVGTVQGEIAEWYRGNGGHAKLNADIDRTIEECAELNFAASADHVREKMADVGMCLMMAAENAGFDLIIAIREKLAINRQRIWTVDSHQPFAISVTDESLVPDEFMVVTATMRFHQYLELRRTVWRNYHEGISVVGPVPSMDLIAAELEKPCEECSGAGEKCCNPDHTRPTDCTEKCRTCNYCGGSGKRSIPGVQFVQGERLRPAAGKT